MLLPLRLESTSCQRWSGVLWRAKLAAVLPQSSNILTCHTHTDFINSYILVVNHWNRKILIFSKLSSLTAIEVVSWTGNVISLMKFLSLTVPEIVNTTHFSQCQKFCQNDEFFSFWRWHCIDGYHIDPILCAGYTLINYSFWQYFITCYEVLVFTILLLWDVSLKFIDIVMSQCKTVVLYKFLC